MIPDSTLHQRVSRIPPHKLVEHPIPKQTFLSDLLFGKVLKKFGISQIMTYHKTRKREAELTYPYMPRRLPKDSYLYDFHFHSYYSDGRGTFQDILNQIRRKGHLNGLCITDHPYHPGEDFREKIPTDKVIEHSFEFQELIEEFKKRGKLSNEFTSFPGSCEFYTRLDEDTEDEVELIVLGVPRDFISANGCLKRLTDCCHAVELIEKVHDNNGLVIVPHPFYMTRAHELFRRDLPRNSRPDAIETINYTTGFMYDSAFHGFLSQLPFFKQTRTISNNFGYFNWMSTVISQPNDYGKHFDYPLARNVAPVASSDAHFQTCIGAASTISRRPLRSVEDLREIFHERSTVPILNPRWKDSTRRWEVFKEIWDAYGSFVNDGIKEQPFFKWILAKTIVDITSLVFD